jgi:ketosteroid isomerase-like protein
MADSVGDTPEDQVIAAADAIIAAFGSHRSATYFDGFAAEATFIFYTTPERLESRAAYENLWAQWETEDGFRVHSCLSTNRRVQVYGTVGIFSHDVETRLELGGELSTLFERETIVFAFRDGRWLAVHEHLSPKP